LPEFDPQRAFGALSLTGQGSSAATQEGDSIAFSGQGSFDYAFPRCARECCAQDDSGKKKSGRSGVSLCLGWCVDTLPWTRPYLRIAWAWEWDVRPVVLAVFARASCREAVNMPRRR